MGLAPVERMTGAQASTPLPTVGADAFGAAAGRGLQQLGATLEQLRDNEDNAAAGEALAQYRTRATLDVQAYRDNANAGGEAHGQIVRNYTETNGATLLDGITNPRVRQRVRMELAQFNESINTREELWEGVQRVKKLGEDHVAAVGVATAGIASAGSVDEITALMATTLDSMHAQIDAYTGLSDDQKTALKRETDAQVQGAALAATTRLSPDLAKALIERGGYPALDGKTIEHGQREIGVEQRRREVEVRRAEAERVAAQKEDEQALLTQVGNGVAVNPQALAGAATQAEARGDKSRASELRAAAHGNDEVRAYREAAPGQITQRLGEIEQEKGWQENPDLVARHRALTKLRDDVRNAEPAYPPMDLADPASIAERVKQADRFAAERGRAAQYLTRDEVTALAGQVQGGPAGKAQAAEALSRFPGRAGLAAAKQVAPADDVFAYSIGLRPEYRTIAYKGEVARQANTALVPDKSSKQVFDAYVGDALRAMAPEAQVAALELARNIAAEETRRTGWPAATPEVMRRAIDWALGRHGGRGGMGEWRGAKIVLPSGMTQADFETALSVPGDKLRAASNGNPRWADGSAVATRDLRTRTVPEMVADGVYRFRSAGGRYVMAGGVPWTVDLRRTR